jgi:hypothetical protein
MTWTEDAVLATIAAWNLATYALVDVGHPGAVVWGADLLPVRIPLVSAVREDEMVDGVPDAAVGAGRVSQHSVQPSKTIKKSGLTQRKGS